MIPYGRQDISLEDLAAVKSVLESDFITQGECVPNFEEKLCNITGAEYACVVNSATSGLYLACKILNLKKNDWVWTSSNTFISTASIIEHANGNVDLLDVNEDGNLSIEYLKKKHL